MAAVDMTHKAILIGEEQLAPNTYGGFYVTLPVVGNFTHAWQNLSAFNDYPGSASQTDWANTMGPWGFGKANGYREHGDPNDTEHRWEYATTTYWNYLLGTWSDWADNTPLSWEEGKSVRFFYSWYKLKELYLANPLDYAFPGAIEASLSIMGPSHMPGSYTFDFPAEYLPPIEDCANWREEDCTVILDAPMTDWGEGPVYMGWEYYPPGHTQGYWHTIEYGHIISCNVQLYFAENIGYEYPETQSILVGYVQNDTPDRDSMLVGFE